MELQKTITKSYAEQLRNDIETNASIYAGDTFDIDDSKILYVPHLGHPEGLLEKMNADNDFESAKALFEAYSNLTPLQATQQAFWIYLTHTELFPYVQKRWPKVKEEGDCVNYIIDHWFFGHGMIRNALAGLWWAVYLTIDSDSDDPYKYTQFFLSNYTLRVVRLGPTKLMRHKEGVIGIMQYLIDHKDDSSTNSMEDCVNYVVSYFNRLGGAKQLAFLDRTFFCNELDKVHDELMCYHHKVTKEEEDVVAEDE